MICDTCGREVPVVYRVVIDEGYNRIDAKPLYNCPECFEKKNQERMARKRQEHREPSEGLPPGM